MSHTPFTRRRVLQTGAAVAGASAANLALFAQAWAQASPFKPEPKASIQLLRWKRFVQAEEDAFMAIVDAFTKATGVAVKVVHESLDDVQPKASVAANTNQGPDMFWGLYSLPHLFPSKCVDVSDVASYLGKKYGGWAPAAEAYGKAGNKWIGIPVATTGGLMNYRKSSMEKAGFKEFPKDTAGFLELVKALKKNNTPAGFALGHASGDANTWLHWALWAHGGNHVDKNDKVITHLGEDPAWREQVLKDGMKLRRSKTGEEWVSGKFLHPHDACFDPAGNIFVAEWVDTGRITRLRKVS